MRLEPVTLRRVAAFATLPDEDCTALARCFGGRPYATGELVFREGDPAASMLFVAEGELTVSARVGSSTHQLERVGPGQLLGEAALIERGTRLATARAERPSSVYEIDQDGLESLRRASPAAARALTGAAIGDLVRRLRQLEHRVEHEIERGGLTP